MRKSLVILACHTRTHCPTCRTDADWRERVTGVREFDCPHKVNSKSLRFKVSRGIRQRRIGPPKPGDTIALIARYTGIKRIVCWLEDKTGKSCGCDQRQLMLNRIGWRGCLTRILNKLNLFK